MRENPAIKTGFAFRNEICRVARRVAGAAAGGAQRSDGGGVTCWIVLADRS